MLTYTERFKIYYKKYPITTIILIINTIMVFVTMFVGGFNNPTLTKLGALVPSRVIEDGEYYRLFTKMFLHGGIIHFLANSIFLFYLGSFFERLMGRWKYILIYLLSGLGAGLLITWLGEENGVTIGASGALFGVLGSLLVLTYIKKEWFHPAFISSIRSITIINIIFTFVIPNISVYGHLGGFITGALIIYFITPDKPKMNQVFKKKNTQKYNDNIIDHDDISDDDILYH
jgi:rhomboid protease GluP